MSDGESLGTDTYFCLMISLGLNTFAGLPIICPRGTSLDKD